MIIVIIILGTLVPASFAYGCATSQRHVDRARAVGARGRAADYAASHPPRGGLGLG